jgi:hypothetical protein
MKQKLLLALLFLACIPFGVRAQREGVVVDRGMNTRTWSRTISDTKSDGNVAERLATYVELAPGSHRFDNGTWVEADPSFEVFAEGLVARKGAHHVIVSRNLALIQA